MGHAARHTVYRLVAFNIRGQVLGTIITDNIGQDQYAVCNDCQAKHPTTSGIASQIEWLENHDHETAAGVQPSVSIEREPVDTWDRSQGGRR